MTNQHPPPQAGRLDADQVAVRFAGVTALRGVTVSLSGGQAVGLIGPNGSGKTTLLNVLSGVLAPAAGQISIDGRPVKFRSPDRAARLGIRRTFQNIRLFADMTVAETVEVPLAQLGRRDRAADAMAMLAEVGLAEVSGQLAATLPYGRQRRLELARAVAGRPRFLLLDEPAAGLSWSESRQLVETMNSLRERYGFGLLIIDHDLRVIEATCGHVVVLNEGELIATGSPDEVRQDRAVVEAYLQ